MFPSWPSYILSIGVPNASDRHAALVGICESLVYCECVAANLWPEHCGNATGKLKRNITHNTCLLPCRAEVFLRGENKTCRQQVTCHPSQKAFPPAWRGLTAETLGIRSSWKRSHCPAELDLSLGWC